MGGNEETPGDAVAPDHVLGYRAPFPHAVTPVTAYLIEGAS
jgi:hypothetical protein